jgi:hypothetical protein
MKIQLSTKNNEKILEVEEDLGHPRVTVHIEAYSKLLISLNPGDQAALIQGFTDLVKEEKYMKVMTIVSALAKSLGLTVGTDV